MSHKTKFQDKVYKTVKKIPKGKIMSYKEVAQRAGKPRAWRAVGNILAENKSPQIPCHRVIRADKKIGGYNKGAEKKIKLLRKEDIIIKNGKITSRFNK